MKRLAIVLLACSWVADAAAHERIPRSQHKVHERIEAAAKALVETLRAPDAEVPQSLLDDAACVAVIPGMKKAGLGIGARYGRGLVSCRLQEQGRWGPPVMLTVGGGSVGLQIGVAAIDVVMLIMNRDGMVRLLGDKFELGADASIAAGPVGRSGAASTNIRMDAKILTYSRSKGVYAGIELKGAVLQADADSTYWLYQHDYEPRRLLLAADVEIPKAASPFLDVLSERSPVRAAKADASAATRPSDDAGKSEER